MFTFIIILWSMHIVLKYTDKPKKVNMKNLIPPMHRPTHHRCVDWHTTDMLADMSDNTTNMWADTLSTR